MLNDIRQIQKDVQDMYVGDVLCAVCMCVRGKLEKPLREKRKRFKGQGSNMLIKKE